MGKIFLEYKSLFKDRKYRNSLKISFGLLLLAAIINYFILNYVHKISGTPIGDLILDNIPTMGLFWFRTFGIALIIVAAALLIFSKPRYLPISTKALGLMYITRPFFVILTHLNFHVEKILIPKDYPIFGPLFTPGQDLFFSGHVAFPFMISLIFWNNKKIRYSFIFIAIISGIAALLAKTHYSIDVFAAPFIAYGIFKIAEKIFKKDLNYIKRAKNKI